MEKLLDLLFIQTCRFCKKVGSLFCEDCLGKCVPLNEQFCIVCGKVSKGGLTHSACATKATPAQLVFTFAYKDIVRECIRHSKFKRKEFALLKQLLAKAILRYKSWFVSLPESVLIPVPISKERYKERGFNQTDLIAAYLSKCFKNLKLNTRLLVRRTNTRAQYENDRVSRFKNVADAFAVLSPAKVSGKNILVVDDITSSGATFLEISKALKSNGAKSVRCYALSRKLLEKFSKERQNPLST